MKPGYLSVLAFVCAFFFIEVGCGAVMFQQIPNWYINFRMKAKEPLFEAVYKKIVDDICGNTYILVPPDERKKVGEKQVVLLEHAKKTALKLDCRNIPHRYFELTKATRLQWPACKITMRFSSRDKSGNFRVTFFFENLGKDGKWHKSASPGNYNFTQSDTVEKIAKSLIFSLLVRPYK